MTTGPRIQLKKRAAVALLVAVLMNNFATVKAAIVFQDDTFDIVESDAVQVGSNDAGASNTSIRFGADPTASENGNITWNIASNSFTIDHTVSITGGISVTGNANFSGASETHIREVVSTASAACTTVKEIVLNTTDNKIYTCTVVGSPGTWVTTTSSASDFEGVYTADAGKDLVTSNGIFTINTGKNNFVVDSNLWNVTSAGALDAATVTSNGLLTGSLGANISAATINLNDSSNFAVNVGTGTSTGTVTLGGTGTQTIDIGTGAGNKTVSVGSTNTSSTTTISSGTGGILLNASNNQPTNINTGTSTGTITLGGAAAQTINIGTGAANKTVTLGSTNTTSTTNINSGSGGINFNVSNNQPTNINTGSSTGQVSLGGNSNCVQVDSNTWDVSCAGVMSGLTGLTSTGVINFSAGTSFQIPQFSSDPVTCSPGMQYYNTTTNTVPLCNATNTWTGNGPSGTQYFFAYDTTTQTVATAGTFQDVTFNTNAQIDGWTHTAGSANFTASVGGTFMANVTARVAKNGGANTTVSIILARNGTEVAGSQAYGTGAGSTGDTMSGNFIFTVSGGDVIKVQLTGGTNNVQILPGGHGTTQPSVQFNVWRMK